MHLGLYFLEITQLLIAGRIRLLVMIILLHVGFLQGSAQSLELLTPVSGGGHASATGQLLSWSIGQPISTQLNGSWIITAGVQQPDHVVVAMNIRVLLDGPYQEATGLMKDNLRVQGLVPTVEPYSVLGYTHLFGGSEVLVPGALSTAGPDAIVDWVLIELRGIDGTTVQTTRAAVVQRDGDVVDVDGFSPVRFNTIPGNYHVVLRHRNHLDVMSALPISLGLGINAIDLVDGSTATYGTGAQRFRGGVHLLWGGDVTRDGIVKYTGLGNDRDLILLAIGGAVATNTVSGYLATDVDLDGVSKYTGIGNDRDIILQTIGGVVATAIRNTQVP